MPANFPTSAPSFATKLAGDVIHAEHINSLQDEVIAIGSQLVNIGPPIVLRASAYGFGNGNATQNSDALDDAFAALPSGGGVVEVPRGSHQLARKLSIVGMRRGLRGTGDGTYIALANGVDDYLIEIGDGATYTPACFLEYLFLDGNGSNQSTGSVVHLNGTERAFVNRCYVYNGYENAVLIGGSTSQLGVYNVVKHSYLSGNNLAGVYGVANNYVTEVTANVFSANHWGAYFENSDTHQITNANKFDENDEAVRLVNISDAVIGNNQCQQHNNHGMVFSGCLSLSITGNVLLNNGQALTNTYSGIVLTDSKRCSVTGNPMRASTSSTIVMASGILETGTSDSNAIGLNTIKNATSKIVRVGAATRLVGNPGVTDV